MGTRSEAMRALCLMIYFCVLLREAKQDGQAGASWRKLAASLRPAGAQAGRKLTQPLHITPNTNTKKIKIYFFFSIISFASTIFSVFFSFFNVAKEGRCEKNSRTKFSSLHKLREPPRINTGSLSFFFVNLKSFFFL